MREAHLNQPATTDPADFVGRSAGFRLLVDRIRDTVQSALTGGNKLSFDRGTNSFSLGAVGALKVSTPDSGECSVDEAVSLLTSQVGEALRLRKARGLSVDPSNGLVGAYVHNGRLAALVGLQAEGNAVPLTQLDGAHQQRLQQLADALAVQVVGFGAQIDSVRCPSEFCCLRCFTVALWAGSTEVVAGSMGWGGGRRFAGRFPEQLSLLDEFLSCLVHSCTLFVVPLFDIPLFLSPTLSLSLF